MPEVGNIAKGCVRFYYSPHMIGSAHPQSVEVSWLVSEFLTKEIGLCTVYGSVCLWAFYSAILLASLYISFLKKYLF